MIKYIPIKEFRELGYLQELNRQFLHPLGLALEVIIDNETGEESLGGIWDYREDPEGIRFETLDEGIDIDRAFYVHAQRDKRDPIRRLALGYVIQPLEWEDGQS